MDIQNTGKFSPSYQLSFNIKSDNQIANPWTTF